MSGAEAVVPDGEQPKADAGVAGPASVSRAAWRLLGAALVAQVGISVVEQGIPALTGFIKSDLERLVDAGSDSVDLFPLPAERSEAIIETAAKELLPRIRRR